jgi:hypothetical protein
MIKIARYKSTRHWAVWIKDELVAVVCYKKGAKAIKALLSHAGAGQAIENLTRHNLRADLFAIQRLAGTLNQRIAKTVNKFGNSPR